MGSGDGAACLCSKFSINMLLQHLADTLHHTLAELHVLHGVHGRKHISMQGELYGDHFSICMLTSDSTPDICLRLQRGAAAALLHEAAGTELQHGAAAERLLNGAAAAEL